nr:pectin acetylesterase 8-like [Ipomoea batatas]
MLPKSCTSQLNPAMCFFAQNVQQYIKTPIFFIMSEFDYFEIGFTVGSMNPYTTCVKYKNCTSNQITVMQDLRLELLDVLPKENNISSRGLLMVSRPGHEHTTTPQWYQPTGQTNETMAKLFGDWYYDKKIVIDTCDHPYGCT